MRIHTEFNDETLRRYRKRGSSLLFEIYIEEHTSVFPAQRWMDFGCVILGWWSVALINLIKGSETEELEFMDGPFSLQVTRTGSDLVLRSDKDPVFVSQTSCLELLDEICGAIKRVLRHTSDTDIYGDDVASLETALKALQEQRHGMQT